MNFFNPSADIFNLGNDLAKTDNILNQTSLIVLGLAYHLYQKEKHLFGEMSFSEWVDRLVIEFESNELKLHDGKLFKD